MKRLHLHRYSDTHPSKNQDATRSNALYAMKMVYNGVPNVN